MTPPHRPLPSAIALALSLLAAGTAPVSAQTGSAGADPHRPLEVVPALEAPALQGPSGLTQRRTVVGATPGGGQVLALDFAAIDSAPTVAASPGSTLIGRLLDAVGFWLGSAYTSVTDGLSPPSPETFAKSFRKSKNPDDFWQLVGDAGYKLKEISTDVGVVPDVTFSFRYVRELSDGDINWIERKLRRHEEKYHDPLSFAQRAIIYTLLSINTSDFYYVEELAVKLLPLPTARFSLNPWDNDLSWEHDTLLRAIQGQKHARRKPAEEESRY